MQTKNIQEIEDSQTNSEDKDKEGQEIDQTTKFESAHPQQQIESIQNLETSTNIETKSKTDEVIERLILDEDREEGAIKFSVIKYLIQNWGYKFTSMWLVVAIINESSLLAIGFYLANWGESETKTDETFRHLMIYYGINLVAIISQYCNYAMSFKRNVRFSEKLHAEMVESVLNAPLNHFFDRVPSGRILNRFSNDIENIDSGLTWSLLDFFASFFSITSIIVISIALSNITVIIPVIIFVILCKKYYNKYTNLNRELARLKPIANGPIASHFTETLQGLVSIRSYR